jgi:hypothetical protein
VDLGDHTLLGTFELDPNAEVAQFAEIDESPSGEGVLEAVLKHQALERYPVRRTGT